MLKAINNGELVYIPTHVRLYRYFDTARGLQIKDYVILEEPRHLLVVENSGEKDVGVHYNGEIWYVEKKNVYKEALDE
jgi:hypothetical protein